jgi:hypothetical protein
VGGGRLADAPRISVIEEASMTDDEMEMSQELQRTILEPLSALLDRMTTQIEKLTDRVERVELETMWTRGPVTTDDDPDEAA